MKSLLEQNAQLDHMNAEYQRIQKLILTDPDGLEHMLRLAEPAVEISISAGIKMWALVAQHCPDHITINGKGHHFCRAGKGPICMPFNCYRLYP